MTYSPNLDDLGELLEICDPAPRLSARNGIARDIVESYGLSF
jgi:hypothetical protein